MHMLTPDYKALWASMSINEDKDKVAQLAAQHIIQFKDRYLIVGQQTCPKSPLPWQFIGLIHLMESGQNFNRHLYNGDPLSARTVHYPVGRPLKGSPPFTWEYSAQCALIDQGYGGAKIWQTDDILNRLEDYNGHGYMLRNTLTPYLWSGTNHYTKGKFDEVWNITTKHYDVKYNPEEVSQQIGAAPVLKYLL